MKNHNRRDFIKQVSATGAVLATGAFVSCAEKASASCSGAGTEENIQSKHSEGAGAENIRDFFG